MPQARMPPESDRVTTMFDDFITFVRDNVTGRLQNGNFAKLPQRSSGYALISQRFKAAFPTRFSS
jgi:hypothetical protein